MQLCKPTFSQPLLSDEMVALPFTDASARYACHARCPGAAFDGLLFQQP